MNSPGLSGTGNESFFSKLETLRSRNKKKSKKEVEDLAAEGRKAMESALCSLAVEDPENYMLEEGQERSIIERASMESMEVKELVASLISWINDELINHRILVRNISDDLYDGQILQNLAEKLANIKLEYPEVTQSEFGQMQRLKEVVATINQILGVPESWAKDQWSAEMIHDKDVIAIIRLLVALAKHFKFSDGVRLILLMGLLEGYFVPLHCYHLHPTTDSMRLANVRLAFELMRVAELSEPLERPEDIILGDTKAVLRLLYGLVSHYQYAHGGGDAFADLQKITEDEALDRSPEFTA